MSDESTRPSTMVPELQGTQLYRGPMSILEALRLSNGAVHLMRYCCLKMDGAFYVKLGPEEAQALSTWMGQRPGATEDGNPATQMIAENELEKLRAFVENDGALAELLYMHGWVCVPPQETAQDIVKDAVDALARQGWYLQGSEEERARSLRAAGWQCFEPGKVTLSYDEMITILKGGGHVVYKQLDGKPVLTHEELEAEAERQGYRLEPLAVEFTPEALRQLQWGVVRHGVLSPEETEKLRAALLAKEDTDEAPVRDQATIAETEDYSEAKKIPAPPSDTTIMEAAKYFWRKRHGADMPHDALLILESLYKNNSWRKGEVYYENSHKVHAYMPEYFPYPDEVQW